MASVPVVVVTYASDDAIRAAYQEVLDGRATVHFLPKNASGREQLVDAAVVFASFFPHRELTDDEITVASRLRLLQLITSGANHVLLDRWNPQVRIAANPGAQSSQIAEHALSLMLAASKNILDQHHKLARNEFDQFRLNRQLSGAKCGIIGFGGIGKATARLCRSFGMEIHAINRSGKSSEPATTIGTLQDLDRVLATCDYVVLSLDLSPETQGLIGSRELSLMKPDAVLVNVARAHIVDQRALYDHLLRTPAFVACLDAWWNEPSTHGRFSVDYPFFDLPNLIGSPHNASSVPGMIAAMSRSAAKNIARFLHNGALDHEVRVA